MLPPTSERLRGGVGSSIATERESGVLPIAFATRHRFDERRWRKSVVRQFASAHVTPSYLPPFMHDHHCG